MTLTWAAADLVGAMLARRPGARGLLYLAVGAGDASWEAGNLPPPDRSRRTLVAEVARLRLTPGQHLTFDRDTSTVRAAVSLPPGVATGPLREVGLFGGAASARSGSGTLVSYRAHDRIDKAAGAWLPREMRLVLDDPLSPGGRLVVGPLLARWKDAAGLTFVGLGAGGEEHTRWPVPAGALRYVADAHAVDVTVTLGPGEGGAAIDEVAVFGGPATATVGTGWRVATEAIPATDRVAARRFRHRLRLTLVTDTGLQVPEVTGLVLGDAREEILDAQLQLGVITMEEGGGGPAAGNVLAQRPSAGAVVDEGTPVDLTIAVAPRVTVPELLGLALADAVAALEEVGFTVPDPGPPQETSAYPPGTVVTVTPPAGSRVPEGSSVMLTVTAWPKVTVPDVRGFALDQAGTALDTVGLTVTEPPGSTPSDVTAGHVISHLPAGGGSADVGSSVALTLATARTVPVPDLSGLDVDAARAALAAAGAALLPPGVSFPPGLQLGDQALRPVARGEPVGVVLSHQPRPGAALARHGTVDIEVSTGVPSRVPDLRGLSPAGASELLDAHGLRLLRARARRSTDAEPGTVVAQAPAAGTPVGVETGVTVWVAAGELATVPPLTGLDLAAAIEALDVAGLELGEVERFTRANLRPGEIVGQKLPAGAVVPAHTAVTVFVSGGLPNLVGMDVRSAKETIVRLGLQLQAGKQVTDGPPGLVIAQEPPPGFPTNDLQEVAVVVSVPNLTEAPSLVGLSLDAAALVAAELGLEVAVRARPVVPGQAGSIVAQAPKPGTAVASDTTIAVDIAQLPVDAVPVPDLAGSTPDTAKQVLTQAGLLLGAVRPRPSRAKPGSIVDQSPAPKVLVASGSPVDVVTATHQGVVEVPDVRGLVPSDAAKVLARAGLALAGLPSLPAAPIVSQIPEPGIIAPVGATLAVVVAEGPP